VASLEEVRGILAATAVPVPLADDLLAGAPDLWLRGESPDVIAGDVALCHPPLGPEEVRVRISSAVVPGALRVSVLAHDRPGLLAATAGALAADGLSVVQAAAITWSSRRWALQRALVADLNVRSTRAVERNLLQARLRAAVTGTRRLPVHFSPAGPARVEVTDEERGRCLLRVAAPDRVGLLWAISAWLEAHGCNILVARAAPVGHLADDVFLVEGTVDGADLGAHLSGAPVVV